MLRQPAIVMEMAMYDLESLGWDEPHREQFESLYPDAADSDPPIRPARVAGAARGEYHILGLGEPAWVQCTGNVLHGAASPEELPAVGDWVAVRDVPGMPLIASVLPRRTQLSRKAVGRGGAAQVLGANVDHVFVVTAVGRDFNPRRLERYLAAVAGSGAAPVVVVNKCDLPHDAADIAQQARAVAGTAAVVFLSAESGDGCGALEEFLVPGHTVVLVGSSGVGKSTLANRILGEHVQDTGSVRASDTKGRHTTTRRDLLVAPSGVCVLDTPGIRELGLWVDSADIDSAFEDVTAFASDCKFSDCQHEGEPGCGVLAALETGELEPARLDSYRRLQREVAHIEASAEVSREKHRKWKNISKAMRKRNKLNKKLGLK